MCRLLAYAGPPIFLDALLVEPRASLIAQSMAARQARTAVNGDGSGVGWYGERAEPGLYRSIVPAWSDANLVSLCRQIRSPLFMAHVRAATSGEVSTANCHPFTDGRAIFTHNGQIGHYGRMRRAVEALIPDDLYHLRQGSTDSEAIFLASRRSRPGTDAAGAIAATLADIAAIRDAAIGRPPPWRDEPAGERRGIERGPCGTDETGAIRFAAVHADGGCLSAYRWADDGRPPSLYWRRHGDPAAPGTVIASEPFDEIDDGWNLVPPSSVLTAWPDGRMTVRPFEPAVVTRRGTSILPSVASA
ncbi:class II glutamine amidotransferase [Jiella avicenniae]|uniref:Class II glutamine amidotransferase n=1 Tax=Jiella avicenniae TaxID=2907202 RepID=A0A9X1P741_9HYPH|nr:class II glutamine amidotransferase [Jiella avicenniae]MCE7030351.1 class II glutamine amidotransferase [Jiella avicenniae]